MITLRHRHLAWSALAVTMLGACWLALEFNLRGGREQIHFAPLVFWSLLVGTTVVGIAIRPRISVAGEMQVARDMLSLALLVAFLPSTFLLIVIALASVVSLVAAAFAWLSWCVIVVLSLALQLVPYAILLASAVFAFTFAADVSGDWAKFWAWVFVALAGVGAAAIVVWLATSAVHATFWSGLDFRIVTRAFAWRGWVPKWLFLFEPLRWAFAHVHHGRIISIVLSLCGGLLAGLGVSLLLRRIRAALMQFVHLRAYLPMAEAPVPDSAPVVSARIAAPLGTLLLMAWVVALCLVV